MAPLIARQGGEVGGALFAVGLRVKQGGSYGQSRGPGLIRDFYASVSAGGESSEPSPEGLLGLVVEPAGRGPGGVLVGLMGGGVGPAGAQAGGGLACFLELR